jgi:hypothetical protein
MAHGQKGDERRGETYPSQRGRIGTEFLSLRGGKCCAPYAAKTTRGVCPGLELKEALKKYVNTRALGTIRIINRQEEELSSVHDYQDAGGDP